MKSNSLRDISLPDYSKAEETANFITHVIGGGGGIIITLLCILTAISHRSAIGIVSGAIYGATLIDLFTTSSVYHGLRKSNAKRVMRVIDHCTIYLLIAGTYTPILLTAIRPSHPILALVVFGIEWALGITAVVLTAIDLNRFKVFSMICYIGMGWLIVAVLKQTVEAITLQGFLWLLSGGIAYTLGAVLYGIGKKRRYFHTAFHVFVNVGSVLQAVAIIKFVL